MAKKPVRIFVADDTLIAREGWKMILKTSDDFEVVGEASTPDEVKNKLINMPADVLLVDLNWLGDETAGSRIISQVKSSLPDIVIIAITAYRHLESSAKKAGADAVLSKGFSKAELFTLIRSYVNLT